MTKGYACLKRQTFVSGPFRIVPIRDEDRYDIMRWRNEQIFHLRQKNELTEQQQDEYFDTIVASLFQQSHPSQLLFSYLRGEECIGYGGLVHINWIDKHAEISFLMNTELEKDFFEQHWLTFLGLIDQVGFEELQLHKLFTYAFDVRPLLYPVLEKHCMTNEARFKDHIWFHDRFVDVIIHSKFNKK